MNILRLRRFNFMLLIRESASKAVLSDSNTYIFKERGRKEEGRRGKGERGRKKERERGHGVR